MEILREILLRVRIDQGTTINDGQVVYVSGSTGETAQVKLARADIDATTHGIGVVTSGSISDHEFGYVTVFGRVHGVDTSAYSAGDKLYVDASTAGNMTNVQPTYPNYTVLVGTVIRSHANQGIIHAHPTRQHKIFKKGSVIYADDVGDISEDADDFYYNSTRGSLYIHGDNGVVAANSITITNSTISNSTAEETLYNFSIPGGKKYVGQALHVFANGVVSNNSASDDFTFTTYIGTTQIGSFHPAIGNVNGADWHFQGIFTVRAVGSSGKIAYHIQTDIEGESSSYEDLDNGIITIDLTVAEDIELRAQWDNKKPDNIITGLQSLRYNLP